MAGSDRVVVREVDAAQVHDLRRRVLRSGDPSASVSDPHDADPESLHLAGILDGEVVACASFYPTLAPVNESLASVRLRFMAVDDALQGTGAGSALLEAAETRLASRGIAQMWANARDSALGFYRRREWSVIEGSEHVHEATGLPHTVVVRVLRRDDPYEVDWAGVADSDALAALRGEMHLSMSLNRDEGPWLAEASRYFAETIADGSTIATVARLRDGTVVSSVAATLRRSPPLPRYPLGSAAYLHSVTTLPAFRRRGIARVLTEALIDELRRRGIERVELHATDEGTPLYRDLGFSPHNRLELRLALSEVPEEHERPR